MSSTAQTLASKRINSLLDENSFVEIGGYVTARNTDFNLSEKETPADGVVTGYGVIDGSLVYVYSQDASVLNGSICEMHAKKIANLYDLAMKTGAPIIGLLDCAGLRLQEATDALNAFGEIYKTGYGLWRNSSDYRNFRYLRRRTCSGSCTDRLYFHGRHKGKTVCKFPECTGRKTNFKCDTSSAAYQSETCRFGRCCGK